MADNPKLLAVVRVDEAKSRKMIQADLNKISKDLKINIGLNNKTIKDVNSSLKTTSSNVQKVNKQFDKNLLSMDNIKESLKTAVVRTIEWNLAMGIVIKSFNKIKDAGQFIIEVDKGLTEISMVSGEARSAVDSLGDSYLRLAEDLKVSTVEVVNSAVALARQGLTLEETEKRLVTISKLAKVAGISLQDATTFVTVGVNAMKVEAEEFSDVLVKLGAVAATDVEKLSIAFQKSASSFESANIPLEKAGAILSTVLEATQEAPQAVGTFAKTMLARFNKLTEAGEDNSKVLNDIGEALGSIGIAHTDTEGQLRNVGDLLDELSLQWEGLDVNTQAYLGTVIGGTRQQNRFFSLMNNYGRSLELVDQALQATGETTRQYEKFAESLEAKINEVTIAWEKFYNALLNEESVGDFLEIVKVLINTLTFLEETVGLTNIAFGVLIALASKGVLVQAMQKLALATGLATTAFTALQTAVLGAFAIGGIILLVKAIDELVVTTREYDKAIGELSDSIQNLTQERNRLTKAQKDGQQIDENELTFLNKRIELEKELLKIQVQRREKQQESFFGAFLGKDDPNNLVIQFELLSARMEKVKSQISELDSEATRSSAFVEGLFNMREELVSLSDQSTELKSKMLDALEKLNEESAKLGKDFPESSLRIKRSLEEILFSGQRLNDFWDDYNSALVEVKNRTELANEVVEDSGEIARRQQKFWDAYNKEMEFLAKGAEKVALSMEELITELDTFQDLGADLSSLWNKINDGQEISANSLLDLIQKYPQLATQIARLNDKNADRKSILEALFETEKAGLQVELQGKLASIRATQEQLRLEAKLAEIVGERFILDSLNQQLEESAKNVALIGSQLDILRGTTIKYFNTDRNLRQEQEDAEKERLKRLEEQRDLVEEFTKEVFEKEKEFLEKERELKKEIVEEELANIDKRIENINDEIDALKEKNDELEYEKELKEKLEAIEKKRAEIGKIEKERNVRQLTSEGFKFVADPRALREAREDLLELEDDLKDFETKRAQEVEIKRLEDKRDSLESIRDEKAKELDVIDESFDKQIERLKVFEENSLEVIENANKSELDALQEHLNSVIQAEQNAFQDRLDNLGAFLKAQSLILSTPDVSGIPNLNLAREASKLGLTPNLANDPANTPFTTSSPVTSNDTIIENVNVTAPNKATVDTIINSAKNISKINK